MSRDFELLQRLEREKGRPSVFLENTRRASSHENHRGTFGVLERTPLECTRPARQIPQAMRAELNKLILRTFLATPAVNSIMFAGVEAKQSAKWIAACTADMLSSSSHARVCLVDADLDSPSMHAAYSVQNRGGLSMMLADNNSIDRAVIRLADNLWLLPTGARSESQCITLENARRVFYNLQQECEFLIVSGPEYGNYQEIAALGAAAGIAILVLDATMTRRASAQRAKAMLEAAQIRIIGSVMTGRRDPVPEFLSIHMQ